MNGIRCRDTCDDDGVIKEDFLRYWSDPTIWP